MASSVVSPFRLGANGGDDAVVDGDVSDVGEIGGDDGAVLDDGGHLRTSLKIQMMRSFKIIVVVLVQFFSARLDCQSAKVPIICEIPRSSSSANDILLENPF